MTGALDTPLTDQDKQRFNAWFEHDSRLPDLAEELNTTVLDLAEWARQPHIAERLEAVAIISRQRHATLRAEAQHAATARLLRIVRFCDHDEIARRAADRLLRSLPAGERPLDGPDHDLSDTPQKPAKTPPVPHPTPRPPTIKIDAPPSPTVPNPRREPRFNDILLTRLLDAAEAKGLDSEDLQDPTIVEDLLADQLIKLHGPDLDDFLDELQDAYLDRHSTAPP